MISAAQRTAATPPIVGADPAPRWTLRRLVHWARERFGLRCCRETIRAALHRLELSWKKAKKLLGRADPERRQAFIEQLQSMLELRSEGHLLELQTITPLLQKIAEDGSLMNLARQRARQLIKSQ